MLFAEPILPNKALDELGVRQFQTTTGEVLGATFDEGTAGNATPLIMRAGERYYTNTPTIYETVYDENGIPTNMEIPNPRYVESPLLDPEEANKRYGVKHGGKQVLGWTQPVREREAAELNGLKMDELRRQDIIARGAGGFWQGAAKLTVGLGASLVDPLNVASAFIPVVGQARYAAMLANAGTGLFARAGVRAGVGVVEGAVGAAIIEPGVYALSRAEQRDYDMSDSLMNIALGGVLGGGLHVGAGVLKDRIFGISKLIDDAPIQTREAMLTDAIAATVEGRPVRADLALREHLLGGTSNLTPYEMAKAKFDAAMGPFVPDRAGIDMGGNVRSLPDAPHPFPDRNGGSVPVTAKNDEIMSFTARKYADNAAKRIEREQGYRPDVVETRDGQFILTRDTQMEPIRNQDGSVRTFPNERQAQRYLDQQNLKDGVDIDPVTGTGREYSIIRYAEGDGPVRYALVEGATPADLAAAKRAPDAIQFRPSRDVPTLIQEEAKAITALRADYDRIMNEYLESRRNPQPQVSPADARIMSAYQDRLSKARHEDLIVNRDGGDTELTGLIRENQELKAQTDAMAKLGELPETAKAEIDAAEAAVKAMEKRAQAYEVVFACMRTA